MSKGQDTANHHTKLEKSGRSPLIDSMGVTYFCISHSRTDGINSCSVTLVDNLAERTHNTTPFLVHCRNEKGFQYWRISVGQKS